MPKIVCEHCGLLFNVKPFRLQQRNIRYCSHFCRTAERPSVEKRLMDRVRVVNGCWVWQGMKNSLGYGKICIGREKRKSYFVHRVMYELKKGIIPEGLCIDHLCRNTSCINPDHLEAVTYAVNTMRGTGLGVQNANKTHCIHGHPFSGDNLVPRKGRQGRLARECLTCRREKGRRFLARKRNREALTARSPS